MDTLRDLNNNLPSCDAVLNVDNIEVLVIDFPSCPAGTMAFLRDEESVLVKVKKGWQYVMVR